jgi:hypothetical protein
VLAARPVMGLANVPFPLPSVVWLPAITGFVAVPQQTPRAVIDGPWPAEALPPLNAVVAVIEVVATVVTVGISGTESGAFFWQLKEIRANSRKMRMCFIYYGLITKIGISI